ncbi:MAG TPA: translocation/assembly module TamB domain-containing protein [Methylomusa anaerophila]|uniref:AsmA family protein n=1 Tax=Methylomusa anaerophila TaxID=1930071 RepID=A0A348AKF2_9FIRM|nr:translocation/assembly module TamB domain-containing protein [Methylomusa anaerophila]BBB91550.1 AsmA family protein [Methylomusa anaerophila]HML89512.1 translocation/assembly module TamB domain-containing protein [Methylomusa anaerophila]
MRTKVTALIVTLTLIILTTGAAWWWTVKSHTVLNEAKETIAAELSKAFGLPVSIDQLAVSGLNAASAANITIYDKQGQILAQIEQLTVNYSLFSIFTGKAPVSAINEINVTRPHFFLTEYVNGTWNIADISRTKDESAADFTGKVQLQEGIISITTPQGQWDLTQLAGTVDFARADATGFSLAFMNDITNYRTSGTANLKNGRLSAALQADKLNPANYQTILPAEVKVRFAGGSLTNMDVAVNYDGKNFAYAGEFRLTDLAAEVYGKDVTQVNGLITFTSEHVYILGTKALVAGQPVSLQGQVALGGEQPVLDITANSPGFDFATVISGFPLTGAVKFESSIRGVPDNPVVDAAIQLADSSYDRYSIRNAKAKLHYDNGVVGVENAAANVLGGDIAFSGNYHVDNQHYQISLRGQGLNSAELLAGSDLPALSGRTAVEIYASGQGTNLTQASMSGQVSVSEGSVAGMPFDKFYGAFEQTGGLLTITQASMALPAGGLISSSGKADLAGGNINFAVDGFSVDVGKLPLTVPNNIKLAGTADFTASVAGTLARPEAEASLTINDMAVQDQNFGQANGQVKLSPEQIVIRNMVLVDGVGQNELSGSIELTGMKNVNLKLITTNVRAEKLAQIFATDQRITGNLDHELLITGPLADVSLAGRVKLTEGSFNGQLIAEAQGTYQRRNGMIYIPELAIRSLDSRITLSGTVGSNNELSLNVAARDIDITRLGIQYPYPVAGMANLNGAVTGTAASPVFTGNMMSSFIKANGQVLTNINAQFQYNAGLLDLYHLQVDHGAGKFNFTGSVDTRSGRMFGRITAESGNVAGLLALANQPDRGVSGFLDGDILLGGTFSNPSIQLLGKIREGRIKNYALTTVDLDASLADHVVTINQFTAKQSGDGIIAARGTADVNGEINMEVGGKNVDAGLFSALFDTTVQPYGKVSFTAQATGATKDPRVALSLDISDGGVVNAQFDHLYGLFLYNSGSIHVNQLYIAKGPYKASAYGEIPLKALNSKGRKQADIRDSMNLAIHLDNADLSILPLLTKEVSWAAGPTAGELVIGGTLAQPTLDGKITVSDGTLKLASLAEPFRKLGVDIRFEGDKINIKACDGQMGGGSYQLTGTAYIDGLSLTNYNLAMNIDKLGIRHKYYQGPVNGALSLTDKAGKPTLQGRLELNNTTVNIPALPETTSADIDIALDLDIELGQRTHMYNAYLYDFFAEGSLHLGGTVGRPNATGRITARNGSVRYLTNRFNIKTGSAEFSPYRGIEPVIKLHAENRLASTVINLDINGPVSAMNLGLTSEPAMSQEEILSLLTLRGSYFTGQRTSNGSVDSVLGRDQLISLLDAGLQMQFIAETENAVRNILGVDEFQIVRASMFDVRNQRNQTSRSTQSPEFAGYNLEIGKYLTDKLLISYTLGIDQKTQNISFRYELNKRISVGGNFGGANNGLYTIETRFNF